MSVESSKARNRYQDDLVDLQAEYSRKKKKIQEQNQAEINDLQDDHKNKKQALNYQNEAAVNHIQKTQQETMEKYSDSRKEAALKGKEKVEKMQTDYNARIDEMQQERSDAIKKINS